MKRIYLISAVLLLFLVIGSYYFTNTRSAAVANNLAIATPAFAFTPDDDNTFVPPSSGNVPAANAPVASAQRHASRSHHAHANVKISSRAAVRAEDMPAEIAFASYVQDEPIASESSKDLYGNKPATRVKKVIRIRHATEDDTHHGRLCKLFNGRVGFGPEIGYNQNTITNSSSANIHTGGFNAGLMLNFRLGDNVAFQPGLRYITKGVRNMSTMDVNTDEKLTMHYLELPADLVYKIGKPDNARIMIGAGPYVSYLLSARDRYSNSDGGFVDVIGAHPAYDASNINKLDFGLGGFVGCETPEGLYAKVGAEIGLRDIQMNSSSEAMHNYNLLLTIGYILGGTHK